MTTKLTSPADDDDAPLAPTHRPRSVPRRRSNSIRAIRQTTPCCAQGSPIVVRGWGNVLPMENKRNIDWEAIERDVRAGVLSIREIGRLNCVSDKAVRNKAKALGWERDLSARVAEKVRSELVRIESASSPENEQRIVEHAAATVVQVVREHRVRIKQGLALVELLIKQLMDVVGRREEFEMAIAIETAADRQSDRRNRLFKAVALEKHAAIATSLALATKTFVTLERQAFGLAVVEAPVAPVVQADSSREVADDVAAQIMSRINARLQ